LSFAACQPLRPEFRHFRWKFKSSAGNLQEARKFPAVTGGFRSSDQPLNSQRKSPRIPMKFQFSAGCLCVPRTIWIFRRTFRFFPCILGFSAERLALPLIFSIFRKPVRCSAGNSNLLRRIWFSKDRFGFPAEV